MVDNCNSYRPQAIGAVMDAEDDDSQRDVLGKVGAREGHEFALCGRNRGADQSSDRGGDVAGKEG